MHKKKNYFASFLIVILLIFIGSTSVFAKGVPIKKVSEKYNEAPEISSVIDNYQEKYFSIIKRNNVLFREEDDKILNRDRKELNNLYKEVKKQINNKYYFKQYKDIERRYAKCDEITDAGIRDFAYKNYDEVNTLLNNVYQEIKLKISSKDFDILAQSENKWLKEFKDYEKVFYSMDYGTIGTIIHINYQINIIEFRTLLLMLYL